MSASPFARRRFLSWILTAPFWRSAWTATAEPRTEARMTDFGAVPDGSTINTRAIQAAIDHLAAAHRGTVVIPSGVFVSGALFLKPGVNLHLQAGAVLRCSTDMANFPVQHARIEGHFEEKFNPALINASHCDGLQITGEGTLDGAGRPIWTSSGSCATPPPTPETSPTSVCPAPDSP